MTRFVFTFYVKNCCIHHLLMSFYLQVMNAYFQIISDDDKAKGKVFYFNTFFMIKLNTNLNDALKWTENVSNRISTVKLKF